MEITGEGVINTDFDEICVGTLEVKGGISMNFDEKYIPTAIENIKEINSQFLFNLRCFC
ncbi:hypothetical protein [Nostoc sp.]|uniref:hypothetical protein n=1 Tax=Nostoc sp. TaxID=1180 RepID=UPI002FF47FC6